MINSEEAICSLSISDVQPNGVEFVPGPLMHTGPFLPYSVYLEKLSLTIWQFYVNNEQTVNNYSAKVHLRNALCTLISNIFKGIVNVYAPTSSHTVRSTNISDADLFIVGSSVNGFGSNCSDLDMCLTISTYDMQQRKEGFAVLSQLLAPLRKCNCIQNLHLIHAKVPILKFRDTLAEVDCDLNVNNVVGIYNTYLLAMYSRIDWRVRPLGMFVKHWAQVMDIHDGSRGRLSTYPLLLMLIQYLQAGCSPPILPNLQSTFPHIFNYHQHVHQLDMNVELPWDSLQSTNSSSLADLFVGFIYYYAVKFDFGQWAVSVRHGSPLPIDAVIRRMPPSEQTYTAQNVKLFVEEPFSLTNASRSLYDDNIMMHVKEAFAKTHQTLTRQSPLDVLFATIQTEANILLNA